jgi:hypothetical protein
MRKIAYIFLALTFLFTACEGPQGPPGFDGFDGLDGQDGGLIVSSAFEIVVDFNIDNDFEFIEGYGFEVFPSDVTLVYILWDTLDGQDIWRLMPQNVYFDDGSFLTYNFDFTQEDVRFFLDGTTDLPTLDDVWTQDQVFRVVVVPADNVDGLDTSNLNLIMEVNNIEAFEVR